MQIIRKSLAVITATVGAVTFSSTCVYADGNALSEETTGFYSEWKEKYIAEDPYVTGDPQYYVWYSGESYAQNGYATEVTVSEAHGYGMLITAAMAEYDSEAKEIFDGMYRYYRAHLSEIGPNLMAWQQTDNGSAIVNASGADSAADGDMDIAYALLMADTVWGSDGEINYKQAAVDVINDIMTYEVNKTDWIIQLGDWAYWSDEGDKYYAATRSSDFIVQYMPVFSEATGDDRWLNVYESTYSIINSFTEKYGTGILPDFIIKDSSTGEFIPAPEYFLESENDGNYYYNSCRTPWRISMDYLINGNEDALAFADSISSFMISETGGDPWEIMAGYTPDGTPVADWNDLCFVAPLMIAAACGDNTQWHNEVRDVTVNYGDDVYYGDTIKMLCLIVDDGGWIVPSYSNDTIPGDVNADGKFSIADAVMLQKWLLNAGDITDRDAAELCTDGKINVYDLCVMKQMLNIDR